jgi:antirestriction protein ArdC/DNA polymerase III sliding clamp (beta) subunit (PCNA family)
MSNQVYQYVTDRIIAKLEAGTIPWVKPWNDAKYEAAYNAESGHVYKGINALLLDDGGYMTFNQINEAGYKLKKGAKSHMVTFWKFSKETDTQGNETGKTIPFLRYYKVFHESDIEGYEKKARKEVKNPLNFTPDENAHNIASRYLIGDCIPYHEGGNSAHYTHYPVHSITMPKKIHFKSIESYYAVLFHEMGHSTRHGLQRVGLSYGKEEGVAELCSAYLMKYFGLSNEGLIDNAADYIKGWVKELKADPRLIVTTAGRAEKAMEYILAVAEKTAYADICPLDVEDSEEQKAASPVVVDVPDVEEVEEPAAVIEAAPVIVEEPKTATEAMQVLTGEVIQDKQEATEPAKVYVSLAEIKKALQQLKKIVPKKAGTALFDTIHCIAHYDKFEMSASDCEKTLILSIDKGGADCEFYADINTLTAAVNSAITEDCPIISAADYISVDGMKIPTIDGAQFVRHSLTGEYIAEATMPKGELYKAINSVEYCMLANMDRPILHGVNIEIDGAALNFTALDGYRLATYAAAGKVIGACNVTIPAESAAILKSYKGDCSIMTDGKALQVINMKGGYVFITRLYEGEYVTWRKIMPTEHTTSLTVDPAALIPIAKSAIAAVKSNYKNSIVTLHIGATLQVETVRDELKSPLREVKATCGGAGLDITFNAKYLTEALQAVSAGKVTMLFGKNIAPCIVKDGNLTQLILPIRMTE